MAGYHLREFARGDYGEASKITEEACEFADAVAQRCKVMALHELADMIGAIEGYLDNHFPGVTIDDLCIMSSITRRAFESGQRASR